MGDSPHHLLGPPSHAMGLIMPTQLPDIRATREKNVCIRGTEMAIFELEDTEKFSKRPEESEDPEYTAAV